MKKRPRNEPPIANVLFLARHNTGGMLCKDRVFEVP